MIRIIFLLILIISSLGLKAQLSSEEALAMQYFQSGDFEKAGILYEKLFNRTKNTSFYDPYFNSLLKLKQFNEAEKLSRSLLKSNPDNFTYSVDIGRIYQEKGDQEKALEWFNTLIRTMPANEFAIKELAITLYRAEAYDFSIKAFMTGRKLLNNENAFNYDLLSLYRFRKDKPNLIQEYINLLSTNPEALPQAQSVLGNILEGSEDFNQLRTSILRRLQKEPQSIVMTEFLTWQYIQQKDFDMALRQTFALDRRLKEDGNRVFDLSRLLISNQAFDQAIESLNYLVSKGVNNNYYIPAKIELLNVKTKQLTSIKFSKENLINLENDFNALINEFGTSQGTVFAIRQLANLQAYYLEKPAIAAQQLEKLMEINGLPSQIIGQIKSDLGDIYILTGEVWEATLLYGQLEKAYANEPLGQEARYKNAKLAYYQADFIWAKAQLNVLKSSTSQLIANDALNLNLLISDNLQNETDTAALRKYAYADLMIFKNQPNKALTILDSIPVLYPGNLLADDVFMAKSRIYIKNNEFNQAIEQLMGIIENYPTELWGDDAVFILADLYETKLNQPDKALELFQKIITDFPGSLYVIEARKRFRKLRGDKLG
jgi:tetratricopeptide (TPR) repeat protein